MTITRKVFRWPVLLLMTAMLAAAAATAADNAPGADEIAAHPAAGQLLVASAAMRDPRFRHSVILLLRHDKTGAFGLIINRPLAERPLAELLAAIDRKHGNEDKDGKSSAVQGTIRVFLGGPVQPQLGFVIHSADYHRPETLAVGKQLAMTASRDVLLDIAHHKGPAKYLFVLGYAGWGSGQLEREMARRDWFTAPAQPDLVFDAARDTVWDSALARRTREL